jgi:hypothetical protein
MLFALSESDCRPSLHTVCLRSRPVLRSRRSAGNTALELKYGPLDEKSHPEGTSGRREGTSGRRQCLRARSFGRLQGLLQTMFQFLDQLGKPYRSCGIGCCPRQSSALFELPFELFSVALLIHDGTLLFMRRRTHPITETTCRLNIFPRLPTRIASDLVIWIAEPDEQRKMTRTADLQSDFYWHRNPNCRQRLRPV